MSSAYAPLPDAKADGADVQIQILPTTPAHDAKGELRGSTTSDEKFVTKGGRRDRPPASSVSEAKLSLRRLLREGLTEWKLMCVGTFFLFASSAAALALPALFGQVMDGVISNTEDSSDERRSRFKSIGIQIAAMTLASSIFGLVQGYSFAVAGSSLVCNVRKRLFRSIILQRIGFFDEEHTGELTSRLSSDVTMLRMALTGDLSQALKSVVVLTGGVAYLFSMSWRLTLVMLCSVPVAVVLAVWFGSQLKDLQKKVQKSIAASTAEAEEAIGNVRTVRMFSAEEHHAALYDDAVVKSLSLMKRSALGLLFGGGTLGVLAYGVIDGDISPGLLTSFILYTFTITGAVGQLTGLGTSLMRVAGAAERVYAIIDSPTEHHVLDGASYEPVLGHVVLENVNFEYPSRPDEAVLTNFSLDMLPGKMTALVGPSGGGKSTVASLVTRLYRPSGGAIKLDGTDMQMHQNKRHPGVLQDLDLRFVHEHMATVSQEPVLFSGTIRENIIYGIDPTCCSLERMHAAATAANAHEFICAFTDGYETLVGERGVRLSGAVDCTAGVAVAHPACTHSGGQKQRVAIARALIREPKILVLDEATSALDSESEQLVQEALSKCVKGRTTLVIAHRLSTVQDADCVAVVEAGTVVASGTHSELMRTSDRYQSLVQKQLLRH